MATVYKVKDGSGDDRTDSGREMTIDVLSSKLKKYRCEHSRNPPRFHVDDPGDYYRYIVIEITEDDRLNEKFSKRGFYVVHDLEVPEAGFLFE